MDFTIQPDRRVAVVEDVMRPPGASSQVGETIISHFDLQPAQAAHLIAQERYDQEYARVLYLIENAQNTEHPEQFLTFGDAATRHALAGEHLPEHLALAQAAQALDELTQLRRDADAYQSRLSDPDQDWDFETWGAMWDRVHARRTEVAATINATTSGAVPST